MGFSSTSTNYSPYFMLFKQDMRILIDAEWLSSCKEKGEKIICDEDIKASTASREKFSKMLRWH